MVSYHKQKRQWEREYRRSGGASSPPRREWKELTIPKDLRDPSGNSFNLPRSGTSGVPTVGKTPRRNLWQLPAERGERMWGSPRNLRRNAGRILRRAAFQFAVENYDLFYEIGKDLWDYQQELRGIPVPTSPGEYHMPNQPGVGTYPDGNYYDMDVPAGWNVCNWSDGWKPGGSNGELSFAGTGNAWDGNPCGWFGSIGASQALLPQPVIEGGRTNYVFHAWTQREPIGLSRQVDGWIGWASNSWAPGSPYPHVAQRAPGSAVQPIEDVPASRGYLPGLPWTLPWMPSPMNVPFSWRSVLRDAALELGVRVDSGYGFFDAPATEPSRQVVVTMPPNKPPTIGTGVNPRPPYRPPGSRTDRKVKIQGYAAFQMVQGIFHKATEWGDFQDALYDALPKKYQVCEGHNFTCKTGVVLLHWDKIDVVEAIVNVVSNEIMDRVYGRFFGSVDKAARRLGSHGYKVLNGANKSPMDQAVGEVIKEIEKRFTTPTKEQVTSVVKDFFGV